MNELFLFLDVARAQIFPPRRQINAASKHFPAPRAARRAAKSTRRQIISRRLAPPPDLKMIFSNPGGSCRLRLQRASDAERKKGIQPKIEITPPPIFPGATRRAMLNQINAASKRAAYFRRAFIWRVASEHRSRANIFALRGGAGWLLGVEKTVRRRFFQIQTGLSVG